MCGKGDRQHRPVSPVPTVTSLQTHRNLTIPQDCRTFSSKSLTRQLESLSCLLICGPQWIRRKNHVTHQTTHQTPSETLYKVSVFSKAGSFLKTVVTVLHKTNKIRDTAHVCTEPRTGAGVWRSCGHWRLSIWEKQATCKHRFHTMSPEEGGSALHVSHICNHLEGLTSCTWQPLCSGKFP